MFFGYWGLPGGSDGKESACSVGDLGSIPELGWYPGERHGNPYQYSCLENPHRQRSLVGYSPWGRKESDTVEQLSIAQHWLFEFSFLWISFVILVIILLFYTILKVIFHSQLLQNISYIPCDVQHILEPNLHPVACISLFPTLILPLTHTANH